MLQLLLLLLLQRGAGDTGQVPACRPRHPSFANTRPGGRAPRHTAAAAAAASNLAVIWRPRDGRPTEDGHGEARRGALAHDKSITPANDL